MERQQVVLNIDAEMLARYDFTFLINADGAKLGTLHVSHGHSHWQPSQATPIVLRPQYTHAVVNAMKKAEERKVNVLCLGMARFEVAHTGEIFEVKPEQLSWSCESEVDLKLDTAFCHAAHYSFYSPRSPTAINIAWKVWESEAGLERKRQTQMDESVTLLQNFLFGLAR